MNNYYNNGPEMELKKRGNDIYSINSLIKVLLETCKHTEYSGQYYGIMDTGQRFKLSDERNNYINILSILSDKMDELIKLDTVLEENSYQIKIPTIAADK